MKGIRYMGIFKNLFGKKTKLDTPVMYKEKNAGSPLPKLEKLLQQDIPAEIREQITQDIANVKSGDYGENQVKFALQNSYMPMYILHDVYLQENGLTAQIDFLVITRKIILILECKNYSSDLQVDKSGQFIITKKDGTRQSISDPTEQNRRHVDLLCRICPEVKKRCYPAVVFTDSRSILKTDKAPEQIQKQVIKADKLVNFIRNLHETVRLSELSDADMKKYADFFLNRHTENPVDYTAKYQKYVKKKAVPPAKPAPKPKPSASKKKSSCPHCKAEIAKGAYGWYCSKKCGMKLDKVYGTPLTDEQVSALLNGKSVTCTTKSGKTSVLPEIEENRYQGKISYQWKTKLLKKS
ncbi:MAG: NERD domain-containing protein [Oscillospiraceae bacterium]|nr:NERD domain-containing protein [Oscillospiraceae bacterium]